MMKFLYLFVGLVFLMISQVQAQSFSDITASAYSQSVEALASAGVIQGYPDNTFRPEQSINRAEFLKILLEMKFPDQVNSARALTNNCFNDLPVTGEWFKVYACVGKQQEIVAGFPDGTFQATGTVNKAQAAKIFYNVYFKEALAVSDPWYTAYYEALRHNQILLDLFEEDPNSALTRGEMAFVIEQFELYPKHQLRPPEKVGVGVSPLAVVTTQHPGERVSGGYINSYAQWTPAQYSPSIENYITTQAEAESIAAEVLQSVNAKRGEAGKSAMRFDAALQDLAQNFAGHLVINAVYSHSDMYGRDPFERAKAAGINGFVAESIVWRNRDPLGAIDWWKKSAIHWNNVSNDRFVRAGVGIAKEPNGGYIIVLLQGE